MDENKRVIILVTIALVLALTAIGLNVISSDEVPLKSQKLPQSQGGEVGVNIQPGLVEDKSPNKNSKK